MVLKLNSKVNKKFRSVRLISGYKKNFLTKKGIFVKLRVLGLRHPNAYLYAAKRSVRYD
jgi:hypothetical protein